MSEKRGKTKDNKKPNWTRRKGNKTLSQKSKNGWEIFFNKKAIKEKELKIKVLAHELLAFILSYLMLAPWWYTNPSNLSSRTSSMSSLVVLCLSSYYQFVLLPHYESVPPRTSIRYVQTMSSDVARASPRLVSPQVSRVCHRSGPDIFFDGCASQLLLVAKHVVS
jgi:hypothetical protein